MAVYKIAKLPTARSSLPGLGNQRMAERNGEAAMAERDEEHDAAGYSSADGFLWSGSPAHIALIMIKGSQKRNGMAQAPVTPTKTSEIVKWFRPFSAQYPRG
jgi:hypothetical protein